MSTGSIESIELSKFYTSWMQDISATQLTDEEGSNSEQIFTQGALDLLSESGEVENARLAYDEKALGTAKQHKINAYAISENYETVDLFISIFKGNEEIVKTTNDEIDTAAKRLSNFFRKAIYSSENEKSKTYKNEYVDEIEESSEIFQFAHTLGRNKDLRENLVRVNATILTNGIFSGYFPPNIEIAGFKIFFKVFDLQALYNVSTKSHIAIEINFKEEGYDVPCIASPISNDEYQSYLAIIPGLALANIYERFGARLLEQNVRSFLQFTGKINKGIRSTIKDESHMFLAYNNGIAATADDVILEKSVDGSHLLTFVKDLQIVNGGQTTASIYHTWKKDKADISNIFVQVKLSLIKNKENFSTIVSKISEYANTQNRVSVADLSSNIPFHIEFEKLSRSIFTPLSDARKIQTKWFYERARGQYKNARIKDGFTKSRMAAFDMKVPRNQMFTKEELAKYINSFEERTDGRKILVGPHYVVRGGQKNYVQFVNHNMEKKLSNIYFEDSIAKAIIFKSAEKVYGVKPNAIGDMRYITVPYTISLLTHILDTPLDLYKIWRNQSISETLKKLLYDMMISVEKFIKDTAPGGLYGEWAKKEECWNLAKEHKFEFDLQSIKSDLFNSKTSIKRAILSNEEATQNQLQEELEKIKSIPYPTWRKIEKYCYENKLFGEFQQGVLFNLCVRIKSNSKISEIELKTGQSAIEIIIDQNPALLFDSEFDIDQESVISLPKIDLNLILKLDAWNKVSNVLDPRDVFFMKRFVQNLWEPKGGQLKIFEKMVIKALENGFRI